MRIYLIMVCTKVSENDGYHYHIESKPICFMNTKHDAEAWVAQNNENFVIDGDYLEIFEVWKGERK